MLLLWIFHALIAATLWRDAHGFTATTASKTAKAVWFLPPTLDVEAKLSCIIFLHGRLEAENGKPPFPPPSRLYQQFCTSLAKSMNEPVLLVDYHEILSQQLGKEPRTWQRGPIAQSVMDVVESEMSGLMDSNRDWKGGDSNNRQQIDVTLVTFSMGAVMGLKLLQWYETSAGQLAPVRICKMALVEPVWRCWLSLVPRDEPISHIPVLPIYGTNDSETLTDSGVGGGQSVLQLLLPNLAVHELKEGNHWYIVNDDIVFDDEANRESKTDNVVSKSMASMGLAPACQIIPAVFREEALAVLKEFCQER